MKNPDPNTTSSEPNARHPQVQACNFRSAGRLSNESIRTLRTMHETFARNVAHSLDLFLSSPIILKMISVEQSGAREFIASLAAGCYLVPFTVMPLQSRVLAKFDSALLFPLLDLLLGGTGDPFDQARELTDIDEELIRSVTEMIGVQLERTWRACNVSVMPAMSLKPSMAGQIFATEERVISLHFEMTLGMTTAGIRIALPMAFSNALVRATQPESSRHIAASAGTQRLRERLVDCTLTLAAQMTEGKITVGELLALQPGSLIDLRVPVQVPVRLEIGNHSLFEMTPVRRGGRKTAQIGKPSPTFQSKRG